MDAVWLPLAQAMEPQGVLGLIDRLARTPLSNVVIFVAVCTVLRLAISPILFRTAPHMRYGMYTFGKIANEFLDAVIYAGIFVFLIIRPFAIQTFYIPSASMVQTLQIQDYIIANKFVYRVSDPKHGDIVVFKPPQRALFPGQGETDFIKRVIGVPGDTIEVKNNVLIRNGKPVNEPYKVFTRRDHTQMNREAYVNLSPEEIRNEPIMDFKLVEYEGRFIPLNIQGDLVNITATAKDFVLSDVMMMKKLRDLPPAKIPQGSLLVMGDNRNGSFDSRGWGLVERRNVIGRSEFIWLPVNRWRATR